MADLTDSALHDLLVSDPERGWRAFVDQFTPKLLTLVDRAGVADRDDALDVYVRICEHLAADRCARLRRYDPEKGALLAWLTIVVRRIVVDWIRARSGRRRLFRAIESLSPLDRRVFELYYWEGRRGPEIAEVLTQEGRRPVFVADVLDALGRIHASMSDRNQSQLLATMARARAPQSLDDPAGWRLEPVSKEPDPELALRVKRLEAAVAQAIGSLPAEDAAIVRLLFGHGWSRADVMRALHLRELPASRTDTIVGRLRAMLAGTDVDRQAAAAVNVFEKGTR